MIVIINIYKICYFSILHFNLGKFIFFKNYTFIINKYILVNGI